MSFFHSSEFIVTAILAALIVGSSLIGHWLSKFLRVGDYGVKFGIIAFAILASTVIVIRGWPPLLGIDLGGGSILVYQVDHSKTEWDYSKMGPLIKSISERINPGGQKEISVVSLGSDMIQITMPSVSGSTAEQKQAEADEVKHTISTTGALEFRIVVDSLDNGMLIDRARAERKQFPAVLRTPLKVLEGKREVAQWIRVRDEEISKVRDLPAAMQVGTTKGKDKQGNDVDKEVWEVLLFTPDPDEQVTGEDVYDARSSQDPNTGLPEVAFAFRQKGSVKFGKLTGEHVPRGEFRYNLAIVLDDVLITAPTIRSMITDRGVIEGDFKPQEVDEIVGYINAGSLPAALDPTPVRDMQTDPLLGRDTIHQANLAMLIASIVVPVFMIFYYRFSGMVAVLVLGLNMLMLVAAMILIRAPFTLPALAGLALTVGMAVDNNILLYERLREELAHGAALRMAIRNAFHRVGVVVIDANITHLIAAAVLYKIGTEQVKGFAVTFFIGAVLSIWATMFVARVLFEVSERRRWIRKLVMVQWIGHTKIDFMAWFPACATFSIIITLLGIGISVHRGRGLFDIDFTGGVSVQAVFQKEQDIAKLRETVASRENEKFLPDVTVTPTKTQDEPDNYRFVLVTSNSDKAFVENKLQDLFGANLVRADMKVTGAMEVKPINPASSGELKTGSQTAPGAAKPPEKGPLKIEDKPAFSPVDKSLPKPAESKAPQGTAPAGKTPVPKSTGKPADAVPSPNKPKQSRFDPLPAPNLVAMAGPEAVLLALADSASPKSTTAAKVETIPAAKTDVKAEARPAATAGAKSQASVEPRKEEVKPKGSAEKATLVLSGTNTYTPEKATPKGSAAKSLPKGSSEIALPLPKIISAESESSAPTPAPMSIAYSATLSLSSRTPELKNGDATQVEQVEKPVKYDREELKKIIEQALLKNKIDKDLVRIELTCPEGVSKSDTWTLTMGPTVASNNPLTLAKFQDVLNTAQSDIRAVPYFPIVDSIGSSVAADTEKWAVVALVSSWSLIILYLWIRFQGVAFGVAAVIALIHDVLVMLGAIAFSSYLAQVPGLSAVTLIEPFKINLPIVAAFLTIIGYSVNDTIVVFDRIREIRGKSPTLTRQMVNDATNQTLSRTVLTSFTVLLVVVILYIFGGQAVHGFAFALIIGVMTGTYSSIYVAAPILLWLLHPTEMKASKPEMKATKT
jgi:SecD/SecF fusion protein